MAKAKKVSAKKVVDGGDDIEQSPLKHVTPLRQKFLDKIEKIRERKRQRNG